MTTTRGCAPSCFPELPVEMAIVIGITAYGHCAGLTRWAAATAAPRISLASNQFRSGTHVVEDLLVHECSHAWLYVTRQAPQHDARPWYALVDRLSPAVLGHEIGAVHEPRRKSVRIPNPAYLAGGTAPKTIVRKVPVEVAVAHADVAAWPSAFRPASWDSGRPISCPTY